MKRNAVIVAILAALAIAAVLLFRPGPQSPVKEPPATTETGAASNSVSNSVSNGAGGAEAMEEEETPVVEISPEMGQMIGVKTAEVKKAQLVKVIRAVGRIEVDERRLAAVTTKFEGWIEKLYVDFTGKKVNKGEKLADIYSPELLSTQEEFLSTLRWAKAAGDRQPSEMVTKDAGVLLEGARRRLRLWDISEAQIERLEETGEAMRTLSIHSPVDGYVVEKMAIEGLRVMPGEKLFLIADLSRVWVMTDVYEYELQFIKPGEKAEITLSYLPGVKFNSTVDYVYPALSSETRTAKIRFDIPNRNLRLMPQMFTDVEVRVNLGTRLAIPEEAVIDTGTRSIVYVDKGEGYYEPREIRTGIRAEGMREVLVGLKSGERVASSATFLIDSEAQLKGIKPLEGIKPDKTEKPSGSVDTGQKPVHRH